MSDEEVSQFLYHWPTWARPSQIPPDTDWLTWLFLAGRGAGKSRAGAEWIRREVESGRRKRLALVARTAADVRDVLVEGESGILAISPPWNMPLYQPSKRRLTWPNGAIATTYSAEEPDALRGPQHDGAWCDETAAWKYPETWDNLMLGLRLGDKPQVVVTTTPKPKKIIRDLIKAKTTVVTRGSTYDNRLNLAESFFQHVVSKYEGTTMGRQELHAEVLDEMPGALWQRHMFDELRVEKAPRLKHIVVAIDPSVTSNEDSDEAGIIVAGRGYDDHGYVLADLSMRASPKTWARTAIDAYYDFEGDRVVAETNNGGEMIELTIHTIDKNIPYKAVKASRGKRTRAEPVSALYEQGKIHHVGLFEALEDECCFPSSTLVDATQVIAGSQRLYSGPLITIDTVCGVLEMTATHRILTERGWLQAKDVAPDYRVWYNPLYGTTRDYSKPIVEYPVFTARRIPAYRYRLTNGVASIYRSSSSAFTWCPFHVQSRNTNEKCAYDRCRNCLLCWFNRWRGVRPFCTQQSPWTGEATCLTINDESVSDAMVSGTHQWSQFIRFAWENVSRRIQEKLATMLAVRHSGTWLSPNVQTSLAASCHQKSPNDDVSILGTPTITRSTWFANNATRMGNSGYCEGLESTPVVAIRRREVRNVPVYNLETSNHWYLAGGLVVHNCNFTVDTEESPNHMDALVWAFTELMVEGGDPATLIYLKEQNVKRANEPTKKEQPKEWLPGVVRR
jgi:phage terminase large subunit-like protein